MISDMQNTGGEARVPGQQLVHGTISAAEIVIRLLIQRLIVGKPLVCKALQEPLVALVADGGDRPVAADNGNAPVPAGKQKTGRAPSGGGIVDAPRWTGFQSSGDLQVW